MTIGASHRSLVTMVSIATAMVVTSLLGSIHAMMPTQSRLSHSLGQTPFATQGNQIVDVRGTAQRLSCVNWPAHMETLLPEGLQHQSLDTIINVGIIGAGFNCVRLTYSIDLAVSALQPSLTARQSLQSLGLLDAIAGFAKSNPTLIDLPVIKVFDALVLALHAQRIGILLDNHVSKAMWCCNQNDGNVCLLLVMLRL